MLMKESRIAGGRVGIYLPDHPGANNRGYVLRSRVVIEKKLGRLLLPGEMVHHKDLDKNNDDPENLKLKTQSAHAKGHYYNGDYDNFINANKRTLDYEKIAELRSQGFGYKKTAKMLRYNVNSVQSVFKRMRDGLILVT